MMGVQMIILCVGLVFGVGFLLSSEQNEERQKKIKEDEEKYGGIVAAYKRLRETIEFNEQYRDRVSPGSHVSWDLLIYRDNKNLSMLFNSYHTNSETIPDFLEELRTFSNYYKISTPIPKEDSSLEEIKDFYTIQIPIDRIEYYYTQYDVRYETEVSGGGVSVGGAVVGGVLGGAAGAAIGGRKGIELQKIEYDDSKVILFYFDENGNRLCHYFFGKSSIVAFDTIIPEKSYNIVVSGKFAKVD